MKLKITISEEEVKTIVAEHLLHSMGLIVAPADLSFAGSYDHKIVLGNYDSFEYPQKPPEHPAPRRPEPKLSPPEVLNVQPSAERVSDEQITGRMERTPPDAATFDEFSAVAKAPEEPF